jgi:hypothetical protein
MWLKTVAAMPTFSLVSAVGALGSVAAADQFELQGVWKGESTCVTSAAACVNETVVYYLEEVPGQPDQINVRADKIVDGKPITMGRGPWTLDRARRKLEWSVSGRLWSLSIDGRRMEGTLTLADGTVFRKMTLQKFS